MGGGGGWWWWAGHTCMTFTCILYVIKEQKALVIYVLREGEIGLGGDFLTQIIF